MNHLDSELRHLKALDARIEKVGDRYASGRLTFFFLALVFAFLGLAIGPWKIVFHNVALLLFVAFLTLVWKHHNLKTKLVRLKHRIELAKKRVAIARHDWAAIPTLPDVSKLTLPSYFDDLDLIHGHSLFRLLSHAISSLGLLRLCERFGDAAIPAAEILRRQAATETVSRYRLLRRRFLVAARSDGGWIDSEKLSLLVKENTLLKPGATVVFAAYCLLYLASWVSFFVSVIWAVEPYFPFLSLTAVLLYPLVGKRIGAVGAYRFAVSLSFSIGKLESVFQVLERVGRYRNPGLDSLLQPFTERGSGMPSVQIRHLNRVIGALGVRQNYLAHLISHLLVPWDFFWTFELEKLRKRLERDLPAWLEAHAEFEVCVSLAEYRSCFPQHVFPKLLAESGQEFFLLGAELKHPLIRPEKARGNPIALGHDSKCLLITGSNMSGKSTYLRAVGLAVLLARAGAVVPAASFAFRNLRLATSLRRSDSLEEGLSSFYAEVKQLKAILDLSQSADPVLYLIDEVLRGTNNRERLVGSRHFLNELLRSNACGIVTTHDLELAELAAVNSEIKNFHFSDEVVNGRMVFHYALSPGPCATTNALRVMRLAGIGVPESAEAGK